ncbi:MAG: hypothetical protein F4X20_07935 [Dehalococcoidia bacterium]|nr:hypothetical protein [Dehalococcoidia bacterium]
MLEEHGISTVVVNQGLQQPMRVKPPRSLYVKHPYGQPFGQPGNVEQQRTIVEDALDLLETVKETGTIVHSPYRWRREDFAAIRRERGGQK